MRRGASAIVARLRPSRRAERDVARKIAAAYVPWLRAAFIRELRAVGIRATDAAEDGPSPRTLALEALARVRERLRTDPPRPPDLTPDGAMIVEGAHASAVAAVRWAGGNLAAIPVLTDELTAERVAMWTREATVRIVALPSDAVTRLERMMVTRYTEGTRVETIARAFEEQLGVTDRHARLLARDQTAKLNASTMRADFTAAGIDSYVWSTSEDERVREDHRELDGTTWQWSDPPVADQRTGERGHPGEVFQCRCVPLPVAVTRGSA